MVEKSDTAGKVVEKVKEVLVLTEECGTNVIETLVDKVVTELQRGDDELEVDAVAI